MPTPNDEAPSSPGTGSEKAVSNTDELINVLQGLTPESGEKSKDTISSRPYDPQKSHDEARRRVALWLLGLLTALLAFAFIGFFVIFIWAAPSRTPSVKELLELVQLVLTPLLTLVSAATGFYFGSHHAQNDDRKG